MLIKKLLLFILFIQYILSCQTEAKMEIKTLAFDNNGKIPIKYVMPGAGGQNISIPLEWKNAPNGTKSFAILMDDPHPVAQNWVHWMIINIPASQTKIVEGTSGKLDKNIVEINNSFGNIGYGGPQPPPGTGDHPYVTTIYALNVEKINISQTSSRETFLKAIEGKVIEKAQITGKFGR